MLTALAVLLLVFFESSQAATEKPACFYLDKEKLNGELVPVRLTAAGKEAYLLLGLTGLLQNGERKCPWSLNGGSGTKEAFSLDGEHAVPILDPGCETPFGHEVTGVGFGDWYLTLCGVTDGQALHLRHEDDEYVVPVQALKQWTRYEPGKFPIQGDREE